MSLPTRNPRLLLPIGLCFHGTDFQQAKVCTQNSPKKHLLFPRAFLRSLCSQTFSKHWNVIPTSSWSHNGGTKPQQPCPAELQTFLTWRKGNVSCMATTGQSLDLQEPERWTFACRLAPRLEKAEGQQELKM